MRPQHVFDRLPVPRALRRLVYATYVATRASPRRYLAEARCRDDPVRFVLDVLASSWRHGSNLADYLLYCFEERSESERREWVTLGIARDLHVQLGARAAPEVLVDKLAFAERFSDHIGRKVVSLGSDPCRSVGEVQIEGRAMVKPRFGYGGRSATVVTVDVDDGISPDQGCWGDGSAWVVEGYLRQHDALAAFHPGSLNTVRVQTVHHGSGAVEAVRAALRVGNGTAVDNFSRGGLAAAVDPEVGEVVGAGTPKVPGGSFHEAHPLTGTRFRGARIPYWPEVRALLAEASRTIPEVRSVGWDVAILPDRPVLVEGNHDWHHDIIQVPHQAGARRCFASYADVERTFS